MRALVIPGPGEWRLEERPFPTLEEGNVLLRVRAVSLCGTDLSTFTGRNPLVSYPRVPGHEIAATVEEIRGAADGIRAGMDVAVSPYTNCGNCAACRRRRPNACRFNQTFGVQREGALTDYICAPISRLVVAEGVSPRHLSIVEPLSVGAHAASRGRVTEQDCVAVIGCGGVGMGAIAAAAFRGAKVVAIDVEERKLQLAKRAGAAETIHTASEPLHERLQELTEGHGPDVIIEAIGTPATFRSAVEEVAFTGRVVYIGYAKEPVTYESRWFVQKELDILGSRNALPEDFATVIEILRQGRFPAEEAISHVVSLEQAGETLRAWSENPGQFQKILVEVNA